MNCGLIWDKLRDSTVFITGVTGLIGGALIRTLAAANDAMSLNIKLFGNGRNSYKGEALRCEYGIEFLCGDIREPLLTETLPPTLDYIFHCAAITQSSEMVSRPVDVITTSVDGTRNMLELAREKHCKSMVYLSSMEVYGQTSLREVTECDLGYVDISVPRSSYPTSKRLCEALCVAYAAQYELPVKTARLARTFGADTPRNNNDMRVAAQFARKALAHEDIELHTQGDSVMNCCDTIDAVYALLTIICKGEDGEAYNVANPAASMAVHKMAELVARDVCGGKIKVVIRVPDNIAARGYAPDVGYSLNINKLKALGWEPHYGLADMFCRMLEGWKTE